MAEEEKHADLPEPLNMLSQSKAATRLYRLDNPSLDYDEWFLANERKHYSEWGRVMYDMCKNFPSVVRFDEEMEAIVIEDVSRFAEDVLPKYLHQEQQDNGSRGKAPWFRNMKSNAHGLYEVWERKFLLSPRLFSPIARSARAASQE